MVTKDLDKMRIELNIFIDNFALSSEIVVRKAREFEDAINKYYDIKDGAYWQQRAKKLEALLLKAHAICPEISMVEIESLIEV